MNGSTETSLHLFWYLTGGVGSLVGFPVGYSGDEGKIKVKYVM